MPTISGTPVRRLYTQADLPEDWKYDDYLGYPGQPPYTRGIHRDMYRGKLWTMRQYAGFGTAAESNARYRYLLFAAHGYRESRWFYGMTRALPAPLPEAAVPAAA